MLRGQGQDVFLMFVIELVSMVCCYQVRHVRLWILHIFSLQPRDSFLQSAFCTLALTLRGADSPRCASTYRSISAGVSVSRGAEAAPAREDCELNVDLSSAGCGSIEPHWQAEHRIHQSV